MEKIVFQSDDPEVIAFLYSLGRSRSRVLNQLIKDCIEDGGGYISPRIMAETGFSYKGKKPVIPYSDRKKMYLTGINRPINTAPAAKRKQKHTVPKPVAPKIDSIPAEPEEPVVEVSEPVVVQENLSADSPGTTITIGNPELIMAGLSAFGI